MNKYSRYYQSCRAAEELYGKIKQIESELIKDIQNEELARLRNHLLIKYKILKDFIIKFENPTNTAKPVQNVYRCVKQNNISYYEN